MRPRAQEPVITTAAAKTTAASTTKAEKGNVELLLVMVKHNGLQCHCVGGDDDGDDEHTDFGIPLAEEELWFQPAQQCLQDKAGNVSIHHEANNDKEDIWSAHLPHKVATRGALHTKEKKLNKIRFSILY